MRRLTKALFLASLIPAISPSLEAGARPQEPDPPRARHKIRIDKNTRDLQRRLAAFDVTSTIDYGSYLLCEVDTANPSRLTANARESITILDDYYLVKLRETTIDVQRPLPIVPEALSSPSDAEGEQLQIVQFAGPPKTEWLRELRAIEGLRLVQPIPNNAQLVYADRAAREKIRELVTERIEFQWTGPYHPRYALSSRVSLGANAPQRVTIQCVDHPAVEETLNAIREAAVEIQRDDYRVAGLRNIQVLLPPDRIAAIARRADVLNVEPNPEPRPLDERQGQILRNALSGNSLTGPGYLFWLNGLGFNSTFDFVVDVTDTGIDRGSTNASELHPDFLDAGGASRVAYAVKVDGSTIQTGATDAEDTGGHGTIDCAIVAGWNDTHGDSAHEDPDGYQYGLGIAPHARIGSRRVFDPTWTGPDFTELINHAYANGARISSNSWGSKMPTASYDAVSQEYDALTRDARPSTALDGGSPGNQEMLIVFAAGNAGPGPGTIGDFGSTAKNTFTVGASENLRVDGVTDGCAQTNGDSDGSSDTVNFSSRGPCSDGRVKPDIMAPGTKIHGAATQAANFDGSGVCGGPSNDGVAPPTDAYHPPGQTLYTWSSGTSHACPAVSGAAALTRRWFEMRGWPTPSPAMLKAYLMNAAEYMEGTGAGGTLPSTDQGIGRLQLERAFDAVPRLHVDQTRTFTTSGQTYTIGGEIADPTRPVRVSLVWTDAPGFPSAAKALVNDLDLEVTIGTTTYRGNVFSGRHSTSGGGADDTNNVESVFLPAGTTGTIDVTVTATSINGDGVPGFGDSFDQDFALVVYNVLAPMRNPVNVSLVLDRSGSMNAVAPGGSRPKIEVLKNAVELFVKVWSPFAVPGDSLGVSTFSSSVANFPTTPPFLVPYETSANSVIAHVNSLNPAGLTALGGGMQSAYQALAATPPGSRYMLVFTDGMQNLDPMVVHESSDLEIKSGGGALGDSGIPGSPGVPLHTRGVTVHTIGTGVTGATHQGLLMDIADQTGGLHHFTSEPDEDLELFFLNDLMSFLASATPKLSKHAVGTLDHSGGSTESFRVNSSARKATFVLSWNPPMREMDFRLVPPEGAGSFVVEHQPGSFHHIRTVTFGSGTDRAGIWKMEIRGREAQDYRAYLIVDDHDCEFTYWVDPESRWTGRPLRVRAAFHRGERLLEGRGLVTTATIRHPGVNAGEVYARALSGVRQGSAELDEGPQARLVLGAATAGVPSPRTTRDGDRVARLMERAFRNEEIRRSLAPRETRIVLHDDGRPEHGDDVAGDGIYSGLFEDTKFPGNYEITFRTEGQVEGKEHVERTETQSVWLQPMTYDAQRSGLVVREVRTLWPRHRVFRIEVRPTSREGILLGPGHADRLRLEPAGRRKVRRWPPLEPRGRNEFSSQVRDELDGSYTIEVRVPRSRSIEVLTLSLGGRELFPIELR